MTRTSKYIAAGVVLVAAVITGAGALQYRSLKQDKPPRTEGLARATINSKSEVHGSFHMPSSADKVGLTAAIDEANGTTDSRSLEITLHIAKGWHVNTNPASLPFLIPTTVRMQIAGKAIPLAVQYPAGRDSGIRLDGKHIMVYDDNAVLTTQFKDGELRRLNSTENLTLLVTVQSCSDQGVCLPPATLKETTYVKG